MLHLELKLFFKNLWFSISGAFLLFGSIICSIYFLYLKEASLLNETTQKASFFIFQFPNYLLVLIIFPYAFFRSKIIAYNNENYLIGLFNKNSIKNDLKQSFIFFLPMLSFYLFSIIIELVINASINNFYYIFIYYVFFSWIIFFIIFKFFQYLGTLNFKSSNFMGNFLFSVWYFIFFFTNIFLNNYFLFFSDVIYNLKFFIFLFFITNPNSLSIIFLDAMGRIYNFYSVLTIIVTCIIVLLIFLSVVLKTWKTNYIFSKLYYNQNLLFSVNLIDIKKLKKNWKNQKNISIYRPELISLVYFETYQNDEILKILINSFKARDFKIFSHKQKNKIGLVAQDFRFHSSLKCFEVIKYYSFLYKNKISKHSIKKIFKDFNLENFYNKKFSNLSFENKQKIKFVLALINKPDLLIMEEPFLGVEKFWKEMAKTKLLKYFHDNPNVALILFSNNLNDSKLLANKYYLVNNNEIMKIKDINNLEFTQKNQ